MEEKQKDQEYTWQDWMNMILFWIGVYLWACVYFPA